MSRKSKGINAERDLIHKFWATNEWAAARIAGSGSSRYPSADVLASNKIRKLAIECKTSKGATKYIPHEEVSQLKEFAEIYGAEPWIAMRFNKANWYFLNLEDMKKTTSSYVITKANAEQKGLSFGEVTK
jgi:Holliday junction resolvase